MKRPTPGVPAVVAVVAVILAFLLSWPPAVAVCCVVALVSLGWWFVLERRNR